MRFGPTSLRLSGVLVKGLHRPKFRNDIKVSEQVIAGQTTYVVKIPETMSFNRFTAYEYQLLNLCDGTRLAGEIAQAISDLYPEQPLSEQELVEWLDHMDPNMWERSMGEKGMAVLERIRNERNERIDRSSLFHMRFSAWDPNRLLDRLHPYLRWLYTRTFAICSVALFISTALIVASDYTRIRQDTIEFYNFAHKSAYDLWIFWFLLFVVSGIHEFGHGLTCKHYGGEVHQMGLLLIYFTPAFYTDCSEMLMFPHASERLWTVFAGIWIELVTCSVAALTWFFSTPGSFLGDLAYKTVLLTGVSGVFFNLNPLMKFDGYYALSQYLEIDNLYDDSFAYLKAWVQRKVFRRRVDLPPFPRRRRLLYLPYAGGATVYSSLVLFAVIMFVNNIFTSKFGRWGLLFTVGVAYLLLRKRIRKWVPALRTGLRRAKESFMAWKMTRRQWVGTVAALALLALVPVPSWVSTDFVLEPGERVTLRAPVAGALRQVRVREGEAVKAGAILAVLSNPDIETRAAVDEKSLELATHSLLAAEARGDTAEVHRYGQEYRRLQGEEAEAMAKRAELILKSPLTGLITTPEIQERVGEYLPQGGEFASLANRQEMRARILVRDVELEDVRPGAKVELNLRAYPFRSFYGSVRQIMPAAALDRPVAEPKVLERYGQVLTNYFAVVLAFPNPEDSLREGMTGTAKIYRQSRHPLAWQATRGCWRWLHRQLW